MELFIAPKIYIPKNEADMIDFLDLDSVEILNAVLQDMKVFEAGIFSSLTERAISRSFSVWDGAQYEVANARAVCSNIEKILQQWFLVTLPLDVLIYFYCRSFVRMENSSDPNFTTFYLKMDALYDEIYRSNPPYIRESLHEQRSRLVNR